MKRNYQHMMQQVKPDEQMVQEIMTQAHKHPVRRMSRTRRVLRPVAAVVAVCVCLNFTLSALAANSDTAYAVMYAVSPVLAQSIRHAMTTVSVWRWNRHLFPAIQHRPMSRCVTWTKRDALMRQQT